MYERSPCHDFLLCVFDALPDADCVQVARPPETTCLIFCITLSYYHIIVFIILYYCVQVARSPEITYFVSYRRLKHKSYNPSWKLAQTPQFVSFSSG